MSFPWGEPILPVVFVCPHCGDTKSIIHGDKVPACECSGAERGRVLEKQALANHSQVVEAAYRARREEFRRRRRDKRGG